MATDLISRMETILRYLGAMDFSRSSPSATPAEFLAVSIAAQSPFAQIY